MQVQKVMILGSTNFEKSSFWRGVTNDQNTFLPLCVIHGKTVRRKPFIIKSIKKDSC
jgi:hypothetical protein